MTAKQWVAIIIAILTIACGAVGVLVMRSGAPAPATADMRAQSELAAALKQVETALQEGDAGLYLSLLDRKSRAQMESVLQGRIPRRPSLRLEPVAVAARGDQGFVIGSFQDLLSPDHVTSYLLRYVREDGSWKIADTAIADRPPYAPAIHAYFPPEPGAFGRAGSPWQKVSYADLNTKAFSSEQIDWKLQATRDARFLYLRFEASAPLPAPKTEIAEAEASRGMRPGISSGVPVMRIEVTETKGQTETRTRFDLIVGINIGSHANFDASGKATAQHYFLAYSFLVQNARDEWLFDSEPGAYNDLMGVHDRFIDLRIPLAALGVDGDGTEIRVLEANSFAKILPVDVKPFG